MPSFLSITPRMGRDNESIYDFKSKVNGDRKKMTIFAANYVRLLPAEGM